MTEDERFILINGIKDFAKKNKCLIIYAYSSNPKAWIVMEKTGMQFVSKVFKLEVT
jgi:hypothetical protein